MVNKSISLNESEIASRTDGEEQIYDEIVSRFIYLKL